MRVVSYTRTTSCYPGECPTNDVIGMQNERIKSYADAKGWRIQNKYSDRKKDSSENAAFEQLLQDGLKRKFDAVIFDSVFRAGKDLWGAKEVLLETFHYAGISFAVVEDDFDSTGKSIKEVEQYFDLKYGVYRHEYIRNKVNQRNRSGVLSWNDVKYGYRLTDDYKLIIDEETAPIVRRMFQLCADGKDPREIAELFRSEKIPVPLVSRGTKVKIEDPYNWTRLNVRRLLDKTVYIGHWTKTVQGVVMDFYNDPIVDKDVFQRVQDYLEQFRTPERKLRPKQPYSGLMADTNKNLVIKLFTPGTGDHYFKYNSTPPDYDKKRKLLYSELDDAVRDKLNCEKNKADRIIELIRNEGEQMKDKITSFICSELQREAFDVASYRGTMIEAYNSYPSDSSSDGFLESAFLEYSKRISTSETFFLEKMRKLKKQEVIISENNPWIKLYSSWNEAIPLSHDVLRKYVSSIQIERMKIVSINLHETDWYNELPEEWRKS